MCSQVINEVNCNNMNLPQSTKVNCLHVHSC